MAPEASQVWFVKGIFDEIPVLELFSHSMVGDSVALVCVANKPIQGVGLGV